MIDDRAIRRRASLLGVTESQIRRDHLLSHLIMGFEGIPDVVVIGGTALNRTHLPDIRISEDLDVHLLTGNPDDVILSLIGAVRLEFPGLSQINKQRKEDVYSYFLSDTELTVKVQIIRGRHEWAQLPSAPHRCASTTPTCRRALT